MEQFGDEARLPGLTLRVTRDVGTRERAIVHVSGRLDASTRAVLSDGLSRLARAGVIHFYLEMSELLYLSSSGITALGEALQTVRPRGGRVVLVNPVDQVRGVLEMYGFADTFEVKETWAEATNAFAPAGSGADSDRGDLPPVQIFGQEELEARLTAGGPHHTHLVSIGNPKRLLKRGGPDTRMPKRFAESFQRVLRLTFYDVEEKRHLMKWQFPKRVPERGDVRRVVRFYERSRPKASGYVVHCWQGVSRSTAIALGLLYLETGSEEKAADLLQQIRPQAGPHRKIVAWFDEELGSNLAEQAQRLRDARLARWRAELEME